MHARPFVQLAAVAALLAAPVPVALAAPIGPVAAPTTITSEIGARIRWGGSGFEASIFDPQAGPQGQLRHLAQLDPRGAPVWQLGQAYGFRVRFDGASGELSLAVDFDRNRDFTAGETIARSLFLAPGLTSYKDMGFEALWISVRQSRTAQSRITDLMINGTPQDSLLPAAGQGIGAYYGQHGLRPMTVLDVTGNLTFATRGTAQESPAWDFKLLNAREPVNVPLPAAMAVLGVALLVLAWVRRPRQPLGTAPRR
jgi:hypothetical protein